MKFESHFKDFSQDEDPVRHRTREEALSANGPITRNARMLPPSLHCGLQLQKI
jgi:hypothetical protein